MAYEINNLASLHFTSGALPCLHVDRDEFIANLRHYLCVVNCTELIQLHSISVMKQPRLDILIIQAYSGLSALHFC